MTDSIYAWSTTANDNGTADSTINFAEQQLAKTVNNSARALMARVAELLADIAPSRSSTGSGNGYSVTSEAAGAAYEDGEIISFLPNRANTSAATLDSNGRGAKPWRPAVGVEFAANNILANVPVTATYRAASDEWLSPGTGYYVTSTTSGVALQSTGSLYQAVDRGEIGYQQVEIHVQGLLDHLRRDHEASGPLR